MNVRSCFSSLRALVVLGALVAVSVAQAQPVQPTNIGYSNSTSGFGAWFFSGGATIGTGGSGTSALATRATNPGNLSGWVPAGNYGLAPTATGITVNAAADLNIPGATRAATLGVTGTLDAAKFGGAVLKFATKIAFPLQVGMALYDLSKDLGFNYTGSDSTGAPTFTQTVTTGSCSSNCYQYNTGSTGWNTSASASCQAFVTYRNSTTPSQITKYISVGMTTGALPYDRCNYGVYDTSNNFLGNGAQTMISQSIAPWNDTTTQAATLNDLANKIASESGWPSNFGDAPARLARDVMQGQDGLTGQKSGAGPQDLQVNNPTLSCPTSVPGPTTTTTDSTGRSTSGTTTFNLTCNNSTTVNYNSSNVTNTTNPDGTTQTSTVTKAPDTPPIDLCQQHPDASACQQMGTPTDGPAIGHDTKQISVTSVNFSGSAQCPAPVAFTAMGKSYSFDYSPLCAKLSSVVAPLLAALAAFMAAWILADSFKVS